MSARASIARSSLSGSSSSRGSGPRHPTEGSLVTVDLRTIPGGAELVFTHAQFDDETIRDDHRREWNSAFDKLKALSA